MKAITHAYDAFSVSWGPVNPAGVDLVIKEGREAHLLQSTLPAQTEKTTLQ